MGNWEFFPAEKNPSTKNGNNKQTKSVMLDDMCGACVMWVAEGATTVAWMGL